HPDHFREVLVQHPEDFRKPRLAARLMRPLLRGAIGIAEGRQWAHRRKLVHSALAGLNMDRIAEAAVRHTRRIVLPHVGGEFDLTDTLERVLSAASVEATLGPDYEVRVDEIYGLTAGALNALAQEFNTWIPRWIPTPRRLRITRAARRFAQLTEEARQRCLSS